MTKPKPKVKVIVNPAIARYLLTQGFTIIDIKPHKDRPRETVFIFQQKEGLVDAVTHFCNERGYSPNNLEKSV